MTNENAGSRRGRIGVASAAIGVTALLGAALVLQQGVALGQTHISAVVPQAAKGTRVHVLKSSVGKVLVTSKGKTIYIFTADTKGASACTGVCLQYWPAVPAVQAPKPHTAGITAKFGTLKRPGGFKQLTVNGWPAYTYAGDTKVGALSGQGVNASGGLWWVVAPSGAWIKRLPSVAVTPTPTPTVTPTGSPTPTATSSPTPAPTSTVTTSPVPYPTHTMPGY